MDDGWLWFVGSIGAIGWLQFWIERGHRLRLEQRLRTDGARRDRLALPRHVLLTQAEADAAAERLWRRRCGS